MNRLDPKSFFFGGGGLGGEREARRQECVRPNSLSRFGLKQRRIE